jgi:hypothetical protein
MPFSFPYFSFLLLFFYFFFPSYYFSFSFFFLFFLFLFLFTPFSLRFSLSPCPFTDTSSTYLHLPASGAPLAGRLHLRPLSTSDRATLSPSA